MILFAAAKTMDCKHTKITCPYPLIDSENTKQLVKTIQDLDKDKLATLMKIKGKTLDQTYEYYQTFGTNLFHALDSYSGLSFRQVVARDEKYQDSNVYIISAMYGIVNANQLISNYRLDFTMNKIVEVNLYQLWRKKVTEFVSQHPSESILNLASDEYFKLIDQNLISKNVYNVTTNVKLHSTDLKKLRGELLDYCIKNSITNYQELINFKTKNYRVFKIEDFLITADKTTN